MSDLMLPIIVIVVYLGVLAGIGVYTYRHTGRDPVSYFLAERSLGTLVLTFTLLATLLSAFTFLGVPADSYTHGLGIFLGVGVTDAFISVLFFYFGYRLWHAAHRFGFVTPSEFFGHRFNSPLLALLYSLSALLFTAPYISIQIIGGGRLISTLSDGAIPYLPAAIVMATIILVYVLFGGLQAVAWTDTLQGILMLIGILLAFVLTAIIIADQGGLDAIAPEGTDLSTWWVLPGPTGRWSWQGLIGYQLLIFMAVPLFPQVFQRFYTAKCPAVFKKMMVVWPLLVVLLFFPAVLIGVWGRAFFPELAEADQIMPLMLSQILPGPVAAVVITATIAALMSTADSQLLTTGSLFTRDIYARYVNKEITPEREGLIGRVSVAVIAITSFMIAVNPPGVIAEIATWSFQGSAMLFPVLVAGLYWQRCTRAGAVAGGLVSSALTIGFLSGLLPGVWALGWIPVIPSVAVGTVVLVIVSLLTKVDEERLESYRQIWL